MEERRSLREAIGAAWGNLTGINNEGNVRTIRFAFFAIFLLGTVWAVYSYLQGQELTELEPRAATPIPNQAEVDRARLEALEEQVQATTQTRVISPFTVDMMRDNFARYPFSEPRLEPVVPIAPLPDHLLVIEPPVVIDFPPAITLRGIMIMGQQHVAVLDIQGAGTGMIVRAGDTFMQRRGRIVRVAPDRVVVNWGGRNWDIAPSF